MSEVSRQCTNMCKAWPMSASLRNWYTGQLVTAGEFRNGDQALEQGILNLASDAGLVGVLGGGDVVEHAGTPNFTVDVAATLARSPLGERLRSAGISVVSLAFDYLGNPTTITTPLNSKYIDVYMVFDRLPSDPRIDATNTTVYWVQDETFGFDVVQGAESNTPAPPSTLPDGVLLARVLVAFGQTQILNADIDTTVRADVFKISGTPFSIGEKTFEDALAAIVDRYNDHVTGLVDQHDAAGLSYAGSGSFANGAFLPAGTLEAAINDFVSKMGSISSTSGAHHIGSYLIPSTIGGVDITDGPLYGQLVALRNADNLEVAALTTWRAGRTNPATTVYDALDRIIVDLNDQTAGDDGIERIGASQILDTPDSLVAGSVRTMLIALLGYVNARTRKASAETITGAWTFSNPVTFNGSVTNGSGGDITLQSGCDVTMQSGSTLTAASGSTVTLNGTTTLGGATTRTGALTTSGAGATTTHRLNQIPSGDTSATLSTSADLHYVDNLSFVGTATYTLKSTSPAPANGERLTVAAYSLTPGDSVVIQREGGAAIVTFSGAPGGIYGAAEFMFLGGSWRLLTVSSSNSIVYGTP